MEKAAIPAAQDGPSNSSALFIYLQNPKILLGAVYSVSSLLTSYTLSYSIASANDSSSILFLPVLGFAISSLLSICASLMMHYRGTSLDWLGTKEGPTVLMKPSMILGMLGALLRACLAISAQKLPLVLSEALHVLAAPILIVLLPQFGLSPPNYFLSACIAGFTAVIGFALHSVRVSSVGAILASVAFISQALLLVYVKRWKVHSNLTPGSILAAFTSSSTIISLVFYLIAGISSPTSFNLSQLLHNRFTMATFCFSAVVEHISLINLACQVDSLLTIILLSIPKTLFIAFATAEWEHLANFNLVLMAFALSTIAIARQMWRTLNGTEDQDVALPTNSSRPSTTNPPKFSTLLILMSLAPYCLWTLEEFALHEKITRRIKTSVSKPFPHTYDSLDIIISYYNETLDELQDQLQYLRSQENLMQRNPTFIAYVKGQDVDLDHFQRETQIDEVYRLPNVGREGATYLHHIMRNYNVSRAQQCAETSPWWEKSSCPDTSDRRFHGARGFADQTLFLQNHLSWGWIAKPRIPLFSPRTGYLAFAPYIRMQCGQDLSGNGNYPRAAEIYSLFEDKFCEPAPTLASYAGQFAVSKPRILARSYDKYSYLYNMLVAESGHWIHDQPKDWNYLDKGGSTNVNPFLGHALERSWAMIFGCLDPEIAVKCDDDTFDEDLCQCVDP